MDRLRHARRTVRVTQAELAGRLAVDQSYVSKYERAERRLDVIELRAICDALGIRFVDFIQTFENALKRNRLH